MRQLYALINVPQWLHSSRIYQDIIKIMPWDYNKTIKYSSRRQVCNVQK